MKLGMKKMLSVFLAAAMVFMAFPAGIVAQAASLNTKVAVLSDLNVKSNATDAEGLMLSKSEALLDEAVAQLLASDAKVVLVTGDLTKDGTRAQHTLVAGKLKKLLDAGKKVYVVPGENDVQKSGVNAGAVTDADFASIYASFGYTGTTRDSATLSYVAEPEAGTQFLMLDTVADAAALSAPHHGKGALSSAWALAQIKSAKSAGKNIIGAAHHPGISRGSVEGTLKSLLNMLKDIKDADGNPLIKVDPADGLNLVDKSAFSYTDLTDMADAGLAYLFTGHSRMVDIESATTEKGNTVYDIGSGSLVAASSGVRYASFTDKRVDFTAAPITTVNGQNVQALARQAIEAYVPTFVDSVVSQVLPLVTHLLNLFQPILENVINNLDTASMGIPSIADDAVKDGIKSLISQIFNVLRNETDLKAVINEIRDGLLATQVDGTPLSKVLADVIIVKQRGDEAVPASLEKLVKGLQMNDTTSLSGAIASFADTFKAANTVSFLNKVLDCYLQIKVAFFKDSHSVGELLAGPVNYNLSVANSEVDLWSIIEGMLPGATTSIRPYVNKLVLGADNAATPKQTAARFKANLKAMAPDIANELVTVGLGDIIVNAMKDTGPADNSFTVYNYSVADMEEMIAALDPADLKASQYLKVLELIDAYSNLPAEAIDSLKEASKQAYQAIASQKDALKLAYDAYNAIAAVGAVTYERYEAVKAELAAAKAAIDKAEAGYIDNMEAYTQKNEQFTALTAVKANVENVIALINGIGTVTLESGAAIDAAEAAYNQLGDAKVYVTNAQALTDARTTYNTLVADEAAVQDVISKINAIGEVSVTKECLAKIEAAETAYNALRADLKSRVTNEQTLKDARAKYNELYGVQKDTMIVIDKIDEIGEVTLNSELAILKAEAAYNLLTEEQKPLVHNHQLLVDARAKYDQLVKDHNAIVAVEAVIKAIGKVELSQDVLDRITAAEKAFAGLSAELQAQVSNAVKLTDARASYDAMKADKEAIDPVEALISAIPDPVALDSLTAITAAEAAYNALSEARQLKVSNYAKLKSARITYDKLVSDAEVIAAAIADIDAIGTVDISDECYQRLIKAELSYAAVPEELKDRVTNSQTMLDARGAFDALRAAAVNPGGETGSGISYVTIRVTPVQNLVFSLTEEGSQQFTFNMTFKAKKNSFINYGWLVTPNHYPAGEELSMPIGDSSSLVWDRPLDFSLGTGDSVVNGVLTFTASQAGEFNSGVNFAVDSGSTKGNKSVKTGSLAFKVTVLDKRALVAKLAELSKTRAVGDPVLSKAVAIAQGVAQEGGASSQGQVDAALARLTAAESKAADYTALDLAMRAAKQVDKSLYTDVTALEQAMADAEALGRDLKVADQAKIDAAAAALDSAVLALVYKKADYTDVDAALVEIGKLNPELYEDFSAVDAAVGKANNNKDLDITKQNEVDAIASELRLAMQGLKFKAGNYDELNKVIDRISKINPDWIANDDAVKKVMFDVVPGLDMSHQEYIDQVTESLKAAEQAIVYIDADYSKVDEALEAANKLNKDLYKNWSIVQDEIDKVVRGKDIRSQSDVDGMANAINVAVSHLDYKDAVYSAVDQAIGKANALDQNLYVDFSAVTAAINAVVRGKDIREQEAVDAMAKAINDAIGALQYKGANYSGVDAAIAEANGKDKSLYVDFSAVEAAIADVQRDKNITEQEVVDQMETAIRSALNALKYKDADYTAVDAAIARAKEVKPEWVKDYSAVEAAVNAVDRTKNITEQAKVQAMADAINAAIDALEYLPADYSGVDKAIEEAEKLDSSLYTNYNEVIAAIEAVKKDFDISKQEDVNAMEAAIRAAMGKLQYKPADYTRLNELKSKAEGLDPSSYQDFSAVQAALDAIDMNKNITEQSEVDAMAKALDDAINALELKQGGNGGNGGNGGGNGSNDVPKTGDQAMAAMAALSGAAAGLYLLSRKKKDDDANA